MTAPSDGSVRVLEEIVIYESPDGGKTIYSRRAGSGEREMVKMDEHRANRALKFATWNGILELAEREPALRDAVEKAEMLYELLRDRSRDGPRQL
jgi:hypothetical protein